MEQRPMAISLVSYVDLIALQTGSGCLSNPLAFSLCFFIVGILFFVLVRLALIMIKSFLPFLVVGLLGLTGTRQVKHGSIGELKPICCNFWKKSSPNSLANHSLFPDSFLLLMTEGSDFQSQCDFQSWFAASTESCYM